MTVLLGRTEGDTLTPSLDVSYVHLGWLAETSYFLWVWSPIFALNIRGLGLSCRAELFQRVLFP